MELDLVQHLLELFAGVEAGQGAGDVAGAQSLFSLGPVRLGAQPEAAEVSKLHDVPFGQLPGNDREQNFQHSHSIRTAEGRDFGNAPGQLPGTDASAGHDRRVVLLGGIRVAGVASSDDGELNGHDVPPVCTVNGWM